MNGLLFLLLVVGLIGCLWVYADASANSSQSAGLWALVAFFGGILGILLYALLGRDDRSGGTSSGGSRSDGPARFTHECQSCDERYHAPNSDIGTCHACGGIRVEKVG